MENTPLQSSLGLGILGWIGALILCRRATNSAAGLPAAGLPTAGLPVARVFAIVAGLLPILVFLVTLPEHAPFGRGQGFGRGFLLGGLLALLAAWSLGREEENAASSSDGLRRTAAATLGLWLALPAVAIPLILMRATIIDALCGVSLGWTAVAIIVIAGAQERDFAARLAGSAGFAATLCATAMLGIYRDFRTPGLARGTWEAVILCAGVGVPLFCLLSSLLAAPLTRGERVPLSGVFGFVSGEESERNEFAARAWQWLIASILLLVLGRILSVKVVEDARVFGCVGIGLLVGPLAWIVAREALRRPIDSATTPALPLVSPLGAMVILGGFMLSYGLLQGVGAGLMLLAAWPTAAIALSAPSRRTNEGAALPTFALHEAAPLLQLLLFGAIVLVYRVVATRFRADLRGVALSDHYALLGFIVGASLPLLLNQLVVQRRDERSASIARLGLAGLMMAAAPSVLIVLYGAKTVPAMLFGLALGCLLNFGALIGPLLSLGVALLLQQWMHHLLPLAEMSRHERLRVLWFVVGMVIIALLIADYGARLMQRKHPTRPAPAR